MHISLSLCTFFFFFSLSLSQSSNLRAPIFSRFGARPRYKPLTFDLFLFSRSHSFALSLFSLSGSLFSFSPSLLSPMHLSLSFSFSLSLSRSVFFSYLLSLFSLSLALSFSLSSLSCSFFVPEGHHDGSVGTVLRNRCTSPATIAGTHATLKRLKSHLNKSRRRRDQAKLAQLAGVSCDAMFNLKQDKLYTSRVKIREKLRVCDLHAR